MSQEIAGFRLSPQQQHLMPQHQGQTQLPQWSHCVLLCQGELVTKQLVKAINRLVERHEILHTSFRALAGMTLPLQVIEEITPVPLKHWLVEWQSQNRTDLHHLLRSWPPTPPNLTAKTGLQVNLVQLNAQTHLLVLALPTICTDAATWQLFSQELGVLYSKSKRQRLDAEPMQYADFAEWQTDLLESEETAAGRQYWAKQSQDYADLKLPFTIQYPPSSGFSPQCLVRSVDSGLTAPVNQLVQTATVTPRSIYLATLELLLSRLTNDSEFHLSLVLDGRKYAELEDVAGPVTKAIPLSAQPSAEQSFVELAQAIESRIQALEQYQEYFTPTSALPSIGFEYIDCPEEIPTQNLAIVPLIQACHLHPFELKLTCVCQGNQHYLEWHYALQRFTDHGVSQIAELFETLLNAAMAQPAISLQDLTWPAVQMGLPGSASPPKFKTVSEWFAHQAALTPEQIAVVDREQSLTYQQLAAQANQLAHYLHQQGIGPEQRVVVYGDRNSALIIAIFGILMAGAAYVPIDAGVPGPALQQRLEIANPALIITFESLLEQIPQGVTVFCLDRDVALLPTQPTTAPSHNLDPANLAYVMFTSGSTGQPKGVAVEHRQLVNYIYGVSSDINSPTPGNWALASTLAADLGHTIVFPCLCQGHSLHILAPERCLDATAFAEDMQAWQIDVLKIVPAHLKSLLSASHPVLPQHQLILGGEALSWPLVDQIQTLAPDCQILNHYGPTETTVGVLTHADASHEHPRDTVTVPVGSPLANSRAYVLDQMLRPLPPGLTGTLYVGGSGVSRGYWQQPQLTAAAFIPDPFSQQPGARLYNTGDRARYHYDGSIEFMGRQDQQVKVRGFRVELAEIEAALLDHGEIQDAAVVLATHEQGHAQLVAYVVPQSWPGPSTTDLRTQLQAQLPEQMVPTLVVALKTLPRLANGKCDRKTLATQPIPTLAQPFTAPRTEVEHTLVQLWSQVLGQDWISIHDNFFELGGDSILCIQMVGRATQMGLRFSPKQLFDHPTIAELALVTQTEVTITAEQGLVIGCVPLTPIQHWFFEQNNPDRHHWNQAIFLESQRPLEPKLLRKAIKQIVTHHDGLRSHYMLTSDGWQQTVSADLPDRTLKVIDLSAVPEAQHHATLEAKAAQLQSSLDLTLGPLLRIALFIREPDQPHYLLLICHHLVIDGVSWQILLTDLLHAYEQLQQKQPLALPPKTTAFQTWATRLQDYAQSTPLKQELDYWLSQLQPAPQPLPQDFPGIEPDLSHQCDLESRLSREQTQALLQEVPAVYRTQVNDILLTALVLALGDWTGTYTLHLDLEGYGRQDLFADLDISRTVGWFTTLYPLRLRLASKNDLGGAITSIKETLRQVPQQGIGYGLLRYLCKDPQVQKSLQSVPAAQVRFNYLGQTDALLGQTPLLKLAPLQPGPGRAASSQRLYLLDISGVVQDGELIVRWGYCDRSHHQATIEALAQGFITHLKTLIQHCQSPNAGNLTPSDFPDASLDQEDLEQLLTLL